MILVNMWSCMRITVLKVVIFHKARVNCGFSPWMLTYLHTWLRLQSSPCGTCSRTSPWCWCSWHRRGNCPHRFGIRRYLQKGNSFQKLGTHVLNKKGSGGYCILRRMDQIFNQTLLTHPHTWPHLQSNPCGTCSRTSPWCWYSWRLSGSCVPGAAGSGKSPTGCIHSRLRRIIGISCRLRAKHVDAALDVLCVVIVVVGCLLFSNRISRTTDNVNKSIIAGPLCNTPLPPTIYRPLSVGGNVVELEDRTMGCSLHDNILHFSVAIFFFPVLQFRGFDVTSERGLFLSHTLDHVS